MLRLGAMVSLGDHSDMDVPESDFYELLLFNGDFDKVMHSITDLRHSVPGIEYLHAQEFMSFEGAEVMVDLSSESEAIRSLAVDIVRRTRELAREIGCGKVVIHPGGVRDSLTDRAPLLENLKRSLTELGSDGLLLENMPWYYWFRKKQQMVSNVCVSMDDMRSLQDMVEGFTLDLCHGYLSCPEGDDGYNSRFVDEFGGSVMHIHASDAKAPNVEGLQIGDGEVDFSVLRSCPVPTLVEIWDGHRNHGEGFRRGIDRLMTVIR